MKIRMKFKDPDTMHDAVDEAFRRQKPPDGISADEWAGIREQRADDAKAEISRRWMEYSEYLDVEFDLDANTAVVLPRGTIQ
jgi:hypothetical protein